MIVTEQIIDYLSEYATDPVQKYIFQREIIKTSTTDPDYINTYGIMCQSKWYRQLVDEQWENGSWGRFHSMNSKEKKQKFVSTEAALRRARELGLSKDDPMITKCIRLMERYVREEETWTDNIEKHHDDGRSHLLSRTFLTAANISIFDPQNPVIKPKRDVCIKNLEKAFANGHFYEEIWDKENLEYRGTCLKAYMVYPLWLVQNSECMSEMLQRQYLDYIWHRKEGIYYISNFAPFNKKNLEDKGFDTWLSMLENLSGFSLFPEFMKNDALPHLLNETYRLINGDVTIPVSYNLHYAESWRDKNSRKTDLVLRNARIIVKS